MQSKYLVISWTGRTGNTFLIQLLTNLGIDTGFTPETLRVYKYARACLENDIRNTKGLGAQL